MDRVLALILGGGRGDPPVPAHHMRSKPAVPIGGKYRLIDVPISNCLHADLRRIYVLTQFNSASLNRHIAETYRMDMFSRGLRRDPRGRADARQPELVPGNGRRGPAGGRHFIDHDADYYLILAGDHLYRMDYAAMIDDARRAAAPTSPSRRSRSPPQDATAMGIFRFDRDGQIAAFEEKPNAERLAADRRQRAARVRGSCSPSRRQAVRRLDGHLRLLARRAARDARAAPRRRLRPRDHPVGARHATRQRVPVPRLLGRTSGPSRPSTTPTSC